MSKLLPLLVLNEFLMFVAASGFRKQDFVQTSMSKVSTAPRARPPRTKVMISPADGKIKYRNEIQLKSAVNMSLSSRFQFFTKCHRYEIHRNKAPATKDETNTRSLRLDKISKAY